MGEHYAQGVPSIYRGACPAHNVTLLTFKKVIKMKDIVAFFLAFSIVSVSQSALKPHHFY